MSRDDLLEINANIVQNVTEQLVEHSPNTIIIVVSNPLDVMAQVALETSGFDSNRVMGMAGILDTARYRSFLAEELNVSPKDIQALLLGGHGDTMVPLPRFTTIGGMPVTQFIDDDKLEEIVERTKGGGGEPVNLPWMLRLQGISEALFETLTNEDTKAELLDGEMVVHSPASLRHEDVASFLGGLMGFYADARGTGKVIATGNGIVHLASDRKFAPDIFFVRHERMPSPIPREFEGSPDLVVEVLSPSTRSFDLGDKRGITGFDCGPAVFYQPRKVNRSVFSHLMAFPSEDE
jgi:hypothetical protein